MEIPIVCASHVPPRPTGQTLQPIASDDSREPKSTTQTFRNRRAEGRPKQVLPSFGQAGARRENQKVLHERSEASDSGIPEAQKESNGIQCNVTT